MIKPTCFGKNEFKQQNTNIEFLSEPTNYSMADEWYDLAGLDHFWIKWRFDILKKIITKEYTWGEVLDIGCGNGLVGGQIENNYGRRISGCDLNLIAMRKVAFGYNHLYFYNIHKRYGEFKEFFSTVLLMDVLEHISDPGEFLNAVNFHLKPEGRVIINVPAIQMFYSKYDQVAGHIKRYDINSLNIELRSAGLCLEKYTYWGFNLIPLLFIRKFMLRFCKNDAVIGMGFQPKVSILNIFFNFLRYYECSFFSKLPVGTSLMAVAKKIT